jgi:hypothetical protein
MLARYRFIYFDTQKLILTIDCRYLVTDDAKEILRVFDLRDKRVFIRNIFGKEGETHKE